jgi:hypothetical protein
MHDVETVELNRLYNGVRRTSILQVPVVTSTSFPLPIGPIGFRMRRKGRFIIWCRTTDTINKASPTQDCIQLTDARAILPGQNYRVVCYPNSHRNIYVSAVSMIQTAIGMDTQRKLGPQVCTKVHSVLGHGRFAHDFTRLKMLTETCNHA